MVNHFLDLLKNTSGPILDLGCGTGLHARSLARARAGSLGAIPNSDRSVIGLDLDLDALVTARSLAEPGEAVLWSAGSTLALPFADATFAAVLCVDVLHWSTDAAAFDKAWSEACRVLRPGGALHVRLLVSAVGAEHREGWFRADRAALERTGATVTLERGPGLRAWVSWHKPLLKTP